MKIGWKILLILVLSALFWGAEALGIMLVTNFVCWTVGLDASIKFIPALCIALFINVSTESLLFPWADKIIDDD